MPEMNSIDRAISLVRRGDFIGAANDTAVMKDLLAVRGSDDLPSSKDWLTCQALLAEINDQTGQYQNVAGIFANQDAVDAVRRSLVRARKKYRTGKSVPVISDQERRLIRARSLYVLQAAIHHLRKFGPHLDIALNMMTDSRETLEAISSAQCKLYGPSGCQFHGVLSLFHYWEGRVEMARNEFANARRHFNVSMRETEKNLEFHYSGRTSNIRPGDERMAYAGYSLASAMAFGVAHLSHVSGHLTRALALLRPASAMLMGTGDNYRRGYSQMLIGAAERALAGRQAKGLQRAISILKTSLDLFAGTSTQHLKHGLHQARSHHQLALAHTYLAQTITNQGTAKDAELERATHHLYVASKLLTTFAGVGFGDPELRYDLYLTGSRILRERRKYTEARDAAAAALDIAERYTYAPAFSRAKAHVAMAEVFLAQSVDQQNSSDLLDIAEVQLREALKTCQANPAMAAVAHLYEAKILIKRKQVHKARQKFYEAWHRHEKQVQNGWVRQLAAEVEIEAQPPEAEFILNLEDLEKELKMQAEVTYREPLWDAAIDEFAKFMIDWAEQSTPHESYTRLGLKKGRWFSIKKRLRGQ